MCKSVKILFIGIKKTCLGVLDRGDREKDNETGLKEWKSNKNRNYSIGLIEGGGIKMSTTVLHSRYSLLRFVFTYRLLNQNDKYLPD